MAIGPVYGNTLSDLMSGKNAAQGLAYSRANAEDDSSQRRLEAFLRLRGQEAAVQAQQNQLAAERAMRMAELQQQNQQFGTSEANRMELGKLAAKTQTDIANATKGGLDPRAFETMLVFNQQGLDKQASARALSARRKALIDEIKAANEGATWKSAYLAPNGALYHQFKAQFGRTPDAAAAGSELKALDTQAASQFGFEPDTNPQSPGFGGYVVPSFTPLVPGHLRGDTPSPAPNGGSQLPSIQPSVPAMLQGEVTMGGVPLNNFIDSPPVAPVAPVVRPNLRWDGNNWVQ